MIVYISIGNSDDKLTQAEWSSFTHRIRSEINVWAKAVHGAWFSLPNAPWQNACWCVEFEKDVHAQEVREALTAARTEFRQDSIAWAAVTETEFL